MRLAIIGLGSIGTRHLKNALSLGCEVSVVDSNPERELAARAMGASIGPFETAPDAMMVCTPYDRHLSWTRTAITGRIPVFVEKPLGSLDQIDEWRQLVLASDGLVTQVGYQLRFNAEAIAMRDASEPRVGGVLYVACDMRTWPGSAKDGIALLECSHEIDLAIHMGAPTVVSSASWRDGAWSIELGYWALRIIPESPEYYRGWYVLSRNGKQYRCDFNSPQALGDEMYREELKHFLSCVQSGTQTDVPLKDGLRVLEVCAQIEAMVRATA